jgi:hypothetical protein
MCCKNKNLKILVRKAPMITQSTHQNSVSQTESEALLQ